MVGSSCDALTAQGQSRKSLALGAAALSSVAFMYAYLRRRGKPRNVADVQGHWLLGVVPEMVQALRDKRLHGKLSDWHEQFGDTIYIHIPFQPASVSTIDPAVVEHILKKNFENYPKGKLFRDRMTDLLGNGIFNVDGESWHTQRKTSSKMFTANKFKNHIWRVVEKNSAKVVKVLRSAGGGKQDIFKLLNRFTLDSIGEIGFGSDIGSLENADSPFLKSFDTAQQVVFLRFFVPAWQLMRLLGIGTESGAETHFKLLRDYSMEIVQSLKSSLDSQASDSFVGLFIQGAKESGQPVDDVYMRDLVLNFLIAGRDTTAQGMSWCFFEIMQHPEVERQIVEEIHSVCGAEELTYEQLNKLEYLQAVISESLRLHPSVPVDMKQVLADDVLPNGTFVPKGSSVWYTAYGMARSKKIWGEDAAVFRPARWLEMKQPPDPYSYPVFHAGPRECLGKRLAQVEMKALLATVLRDFHLRLAVPVETIRADTQLTIGMYPGLPCFVEARC